MRLRPRNALLAVAFLLLLWAAGCGESRQQQAGGEPAAPATRAGAEPAKTPPAETPAKQEAQPPAQPPAEPGCKISPEGGIVVAKGRGKAEVKAGKTGALVVHRSRKRRRVSDATQELTPDMFDGLALAEFPLGSAPPLDVIGGEKGRPPTHSSIHLLRIEDEAAAMRCGYVDRFECGDIRLRPGKAGGPPGYILFESEMDLSYDDPRENTFLVAFDAQGPRVFVAVLHHGGLIQGGAGVRVERNSHKMHEVTYHRPPDIRLYDLFVKATPAGEAEVTWVVNHKKARRATIKSDGRRKAPSTDVELASAYPYPFRVFTHRESKGATPRLHVVRHGGEPAEVGGIPADAAVFGSRVTKHGDNWILVWSQGLRDQTRIMAARLDGESLAITGPIKQISTGDLEAGYAHVDAFGEHAVVTWDEKHGEEWEVRVAELECR